MFSFNRQLVCDFADLALASYDNAFLDNPRWERLPIPPFTPRSDELYSAFDYQIVGYRSTDSNVIVLAYSGTNSLTNLINDDIVELVFNRVTQEVPNYVRFAEVVRDQIKHLYPNYSVAHTGHSLGAATASIVAATHGEKAIVFDSPGVQQILDATPELNKKFHESLAINPNQMSNIHIYLSAPNIVNSFGKQLQSADIRSINPIKARDYEQAYLDTITDLPSVIPMLTLGLPNPIQGHGMSGIAKYFKQELALAKSSQETSLLKTDQLLSQANKLTQQNWDISRVTQPLTGNEKKFLQSHTVTEFSAAPQVTSNQPGFFQSLAFGVVGALATYGITSTFSNNNNGNNNGGNSGSDINLPQQPDNISSSTQTPSSSLSSGVSHVPSNQASPQTSHSPSNNVPHQHQHQHPKTPQIRHVGPTHRSTINVIPPNPDFMRSPR